MSRYLGVNYKEDPRTFDGIRTDLAKELGDEKILVPVLKDAEGEWLKDSFEIALYVSRGNRFFLKRKVADISAGPDARPAQGQIPLPARCRREGVLPLCQLLGRHCTRS